MGYSEPITGHIASVTRGISVSNAAASTQGLPNVDPVYTWVRLAQRVPVRIAIDEVPPGVPLVSGLTATVTIRDGKDKTLLQRVRAELETSFFGLVGGASARPGCIPSPSSPLDGGFTQPVIRDRVEPVASPAKSAMPSKAEVNSEH